MLACAVNVYEIVHYEYNHKEKMMKKISLFDSHIELGEDKALLLVYCKYHKNPKEQHAILCTETYRDGRHELRTLDFLPGGSVDNTQHNNRNREPRAKLREGNVRIRLADLEGLNLDQVMNILHLERGTFVNNYRMQSISLKDADSVGHLAKAEHDSPPLFVYSGNQPSDFNSKSAYNCITWIQHILDECDLSLDAGFLTWVRERITGAPIEGTYDQNIPKYHAEEVTTTCLLL